MATVSNVSLEISDGAVPNTKRVAVRGTLGFDAGDVGKSFRLEIRLMGEDLPGDVLPDGDTVGDDLLYTFMWEGPLINTPFKQMKPTVAGSQNFVEARTVGASTLDEDSGLEMVRKADINTPVPMPRKDEIYARVTVTGVPVSARSPTLTVGTGV